MRTYIVVNPNNTPSVTRQTEYTYKYEFEFNPAMFNALCVWTDVIVSGLMEDQDAVIAVSDAFDMIARNQIERNR